MWSVVECTGPWHTITGLVDAPDRAALRGTCRSFREAVPRTNEAMPLSKALLSPSRLDWCFGGEVRSFETQLIERELRDTISKTPDADVRLSAVVYRGHTLLEG